MKKRYSIIFVFTAAAVLVSSIAYASKKKLQPKSEKLKQDMSEVDLAVHLLETNVRHQQKFPKENYVSKHDDEELKDLTMIEPSRQRQSSW
jgi:cell shape-determining protein MreC